MSPRKWETWTSPVSPHVSGSYETRDPEEPEQQFVCVCSICKRACKCVGVCGCGAEYRNVCTSGNPRQRIALFAVVHLHRDPLAPAKMGP